MIIGLIGQKCVGKDTVADYLTENYDFQKYAFASPLKEACKAIFRLSDDQVNNNKEIPDARWNNVTPRQLLQTVGTQLFRETLYNELPQLKDLHNSVWIHSFELWYQDNKNSNIIISDVRFSDEANAIKKHGGILIKIVRDNIINNDTHISECESLNINEDILINNNNSKYELYKKVNKIMSEIK